MRLWLTRFAGALIILISLAHIPAGAEVLNYFDPPKRFLWGGLALVLAVAGSIGKNRLGRGPLLLVFGLLGWMVVRTMFRQVPGAELEVLFTWMLPVVLLILGAGLPREGGARFLGGCLVLAGGLQALLMVLQRFEMDPLFADTTASMAYAPGRMVGTVGYQNQGVDFLALSGVGVFLLSRSLLVRMAVLLPSLGVAGMTGNRGGILAFVVALLFSQAWAIGLHLVWGRGAKWRAAAGVSLALVAMLSAAMWIPETRARFREAFLEFRGSQAAESRILMVRIAAEMVGEKPWMGWGAGEYALQYLDRLGTVLPEQKTTRMLSQVVFAREAHNDGLQFAAEFGIAGILLLLAVVATGSRRFHGERRSDSDAYVSAAFVLAYMALSSIFSFPWQTSMGGPLAGFLLGWLWPGRARTGGASREPEVWPWRWLVEPALWAACLGMVGWFGVDLFFNKEVPDRLAAGRASVVQNTLPPMACRYRALVGAAVAAHGDPREAEQLLLDAERGYRDIVLWNNLGHVQAKLGKWREATATYERWVRCGLDHGRALQNLSIAYERTGRWKEAADVLSRKQSLFRETSVDEIRRRAVLHLKAGDPEASREVVESRRRIWMAADAGTIAEFDNLIGASFWAQGDRATAEAWFRAALDKDPGLESARRNLAEASGGEPGRRPAP